MVIITIGTCLTPMYSGLNRSTQECCKSEYIHATPMFPGTVSARKIGPRELPIPDSIYDHATEGETSSPCRGEDLGGLTGRGNSCKSSISNQMPKKSPKAPEKMPRHPQSGRATARHRSNRQRYPKPSLYYSHFRLTISPASGECG